MADLQHDTACRLVYLRLKPHRSWWPDTYEAAMLNPLASRVIMLYATRAAHSHALPPLPAARVSQHVAKSPRVSPRTAPAIDNKSRAAGEKDD